MLREHMEDALPLFLSLFRALQAEQEPILSSFLYASILAHDCFERSLGFVLANRLKNVTLLATQLMDVFDDVLMRNDIREAIRADVQVRTGQKKGHGVFCSGRYTSRNGTLLVSSAAVATGSFPHSTPQMNSSSKCLIPLGIAGCEGPGPLLPFVQ